MSFFSIEKTKKSAILTNQMRCDEIEHSKDLSYYFLLHQRPDKIMHIPYTVSSAFFFVICILKN